MRLRIHVHRTYVHRAQAAGTAGPSELEVKHGLVHIAETLHFMHTSCALAHCNVSPESIIVAADGTWKLAGLGFASPISPSGAPIPVASMLARTTRWCEAASA